ncbi:hypothetical protein [Leeuwenhoekiella aequorea]|uniref:Uncharacterized protein n=1 Tax=Leeuwenhoekiella aequorea TaxID=283736 RepID=A0A4Q0P9U8_9FLAO|nr:hypothetical protein [Leeuwenhoekiella aequorea]RXG23331.1 hypothetical protein DSM00_944 [Leeuwenhoekiella aequorea]
MRIKLILASILFLAMLSACDSESNTEEDIPEQLPALRVQITTNTATPFVDYVLEATISTSNPIKEIEVTDNGGLSYTTKVSSTGDDLGTTLDLFFMYPTLGAYKLEFLVTDIYNQKVPFSETITVTRGNAVRIISAEVISFYNKDQTWDPEFNANDSNRLADVKIAFSKSKLVERFDTPSFEFDTWYISETRENQTDLFFDFSSEDLYIDLAKEVRITLRDDDGKNIGQSLMLDTPDYRILDFKEYNTRRPTKITLRDAAINFEMKFIVEWPQG